LRNLRSLKKKEFAHALLHTLRIHRGRSCYIADVIGALAQTAEPKAGAETSSVTAVTVSTTKWMTQETAGQWRASS